MNARKDITELLSLWADGDDAALERLIPVVYEDLRRLAGGFLKRERRGHTLQPTALVHEALLRWFDQRNREFENRVQFFGLIAQLMRRVLVDHARRRQAAKRGAGQTHLALDEAANLAGSSSPWVVLDTERALKRLESMDERQAKIAELRIFGGFDVNEIALATELSPSTVKREWRLARAWFHRELVSSDNV